MLCHGREIEALGDTCVNRASQAGGDSFNGFSLRGGALEGLGDDVGHRNFGSEQATGHFSHFGVALHFRAIRGHGG